ncbi:MAG: hypothetical protein HYV63_11700 [Candidatus Schekmanbacteria bacterium]|nr:hypothetical protein [Candidatus Schekmanbacteria bacterium]
MASNGTQRRTWGRVHASPGEYVIQLHNGRVVRHGPGLSVFLWPWQAATRVPTTIQRSAFMADQITAEKVGVEVRGIAVYRIAEPLIAFRMLDFTENGGVRELEKVMQEMFVGAARRLVANMTVQDCLTRRKEGIAEELMREIQPVVSGAGRLDDGTTQGWGVVIDTIEIQDVRILSSTVFEHMQAPYRTRLEMEAKKSAVERDQEVHKRQVAARRAALEVDQELARQQAEAEEQGRHAALAREERLHLQQLERRQRMEDATLQAALAASRRRRDESEAQHGLAVLAAEQRTELERAALEQRLALSRSEATAGIAETEQRLAAERLREELRLEIAARDRELQGRYSAEQLRHELLVTSFPALSEAVVAGRGALHVTEIRTGAADRPNPFAEALAQVVAVARAAGIDFGGLFGA